MPRQPKQRGDQAGMSKGQIKKRRILIELNFYTTVGNGSLRLCIGRPLCLSKAVCRTFSDHKSDGLMRGCRLLLVVSRLVLAL